MQDCASHVRLELSDGNDETRVAVAAKSRPLIPPKPEPAPDHMGALDLARRVRTNGLTMYAPAAYQEEILRRVDA